MEDLPIALVEGMTGRWLVTTDHSEYEFDLDAGTFHRMPGDDANRWTDDDVPTSYVGFPRVDLGERMYIDTLDGWLLSTTVQSIVPLWDDK